jgi:hypothetical protein
VAIVHEYFTVQLRTCIPVNFTAVIFIAASEICDEDESVTAFFLEAAFSKEQFCRDEITTNCSSSNKMEGETGIGFKVRLALRLHSSSSVVNIVQ